MGKKADYIPKLADVDASQFAMTLIDKSGKIHQTFSSMTNPSSTKFIKVLEKLIKS